MGNAIFRKTGWSFLPEIVDEGRRISDLDYNDDILQSLEVLFTTLPGERIAHPLYGCDLMQYMFRPINNDLISEMDYSIRTAITLFETRIAVLDITIDRNPDEPYRLDINLAYELRAFSSRYNITIPFYTMEEQS